MYRERDAVLEVAPPEPPTREAELAYLDWLEESFRSDPWITPRFRKYMAGPKRWAFKHHAQCMRHDRADMTLKFMLGFMISWPLGVWLGRRMQYRGGVPVVHNPRFVYDYIVVDPRKIASRQFYKGFFGATILGGIAAISLLPAPYYGKDTWGQRPDFKPFPAMVPEEYVDDQLDEVKQLHGKGYKEVMKKERKR